MRFYAIPCMEPYGSLRYLHAVSMHEIVCNHMTPCMESYGIILFHAWKPTEIMDVMVPCMESHVIVLILWFHIRNNMGAS